MSAPQQPTEAWRMVQAAFAGGQRRKAHVGPVVKDDAPWWRLSWNGRDMGVRVQANTKSEARSRYKKALRGDRRWHNAVVVTREQACTS